MTKGLLRAIERERDDALFVRHDAARARLLDAKCLGDAARAVHDAAILDDLADEDAPAGSVPVVAGDEDEDSAAMPRAEDLPGLHRDDGRVRRFIVLFPRVALGVEDLDGRRIDLDDFAEEVFRDLAVTGSEHEYLRDGKGRLRTGEILQINEKKSIYKRAPVEFLRALFILA